MARAAYEEGRWRRAPPADRAGAKAVIAVYEADRPDRWPVASRRDPLEDPAVCLAWVVHYPFSTLGVYNETTMLVRVSFKAEPYTFCPFICVDNDAALACGRELWGFPRSSRAWGTRPAGGSPFGEQMMFTVEWPAGKRL